MFLNGETGAHRGDLRNRRVCLEPPSHHDAVQIQSWAVIYIKARRRDFSAEHLIICFELNAVAADYCNILFHRQNIKLKRSQMVN